MGATAGPVGATSVTGVADNTARASLTDFEVFFGPPRFQECMDHTLWSRGYNMRKFLTSDETGEHPS